MINPADDETRDVCNSNFEWIQTLTPEKEREWQNISLKYEIPSNQPRNSVELSLRS